jgi:predicted restriction endonuclease
MCGKIDCYIEAFSKLRTDKNKNRWSEATTFRAPHKPFLLLSILDLISEGLINSEFIEPSFDLAETFAGSTTWCEDTRWQDYKLHETNQGAIPGSEA